MSARQEANAMAAESTEKHFQAFLNALMASHSQIHVTRTEDVIHGKIEIKVSAVLKNKRVAS